MNQNTTNALRQDRLKGKFKSLNEFNKYKEKYKHNLHYQQYWVSSDVGTINYSNDNRNMHKKNFLKNHGIQEHLIIISMDELFGKNDYIINFASPYSYYSLFY